MMKTSNSIFSSLLPLLLLCITAAATAGVTKQGDALDVLWKRKATGECNGSNNTISASAAFHRRPKIFKQRSSKEEDRISTLPGQPSKVKFAQYGGYVTVDDVVGTDLFYYFVEAVLPSTKPLLLWLNGGPGCSSLIGATQEIGPFRVKSDGRTLFQNPYAWNNVANVLFLESPAGVGFSYSLDQLEYNRTGDKLTAEHNYFFLLNWLERFPEYKGREFYIAGESYAGHYVPQLAALIRQSSRARKGNTINLKGIMIGNALLHDQTDAKGYYDYLWSHAMISDETIDSIHGNCDFENFDFVLMRSNSSECSRSIADVDLLRGELDIYNVYAPLCRENGVTTVPKNASIEDFDPCSASYVQHYLNLPEVQKALHANVTKLDYPWVQCSNMVNQWTDSPKSILPVLKELLNNIRVWVFSGDFDGRLPVTSTRYSLAPLNLTVENPWMVWRANNEVAGFTADYEKNMTFATVRAAGHMVPSYQPARSLELVKNFVQGTTLPIHNKSTR